MATLHNVTELTKHLLKWTGIVLGGFFILFLFLQIILFAKNLLSPKAPPPPTLSFGLLPPIVFPDPATTTPLTFTLETVSGAPPVLPATAKVYKITLNEPNLLALERARKKVAAVGFDKPETKLSDTEYLWEEGTDLQKKMVMSTLTFNFRLTSNYSTYLPVQTVGQIDSEESTKETAVTFFQTIQAFPTDVDDAQTRTSLLGLRQGALIPATSLSNANAARVDFYQKDRDSLPIFYPNPPGSTIYALVGPKSEVLEANFFHQNIGDTSATYPIKTAAEAYDELQNGKAYIAADTTSSDTIKITDIFLAYYLGDTQQDYMMPIIILKSAGDDFYAYVPAIKGEWFQKPKTTEKSN